LRKYDLYYMVNEMLLWRGVKMILAALDLNLEIKSESIVLDPRSPNSAPSEDILVAEARIVAAKRLGIQKLTWQEFGDWMRGRRT
jgi:hypothetical protein